MADEPKPGNGQQTPEQGAGGDQPAWAKELQGTMAKVGTGIDSLVTFANAAQQEYQRSQRQTPPAVEEEPEDGSDLLASTDIELLPRRAFAERLLETFNNNLEAALKPLHTSIEKANNTALVNHYTQEAEKFAAKTPDFAEWGDEMQAIARDNPTLAIPRIYAIAKSENPAKAAEIAKKYEKKEDTAPALQGRRKAPLSLSPASQSGEVKNQRMNAEDAARTAWEETVAQFGNPFA